jgi:predicted ATPase
MLDELVAGRGQILFLLGDAGIGKTRLIAELAGLAEGRVTWLEGRCVSYDTELFYGPFVQILRGWIGAEEGEADLSVRTKLRAKLGLLPATQVADVLPALSRLMSLRLDPDAEARLAHRTPEERAADIRRAYGTWILSLADQGPVVVAVDDLHWADPASLELGQDLLELANVAPILMVGALRVDPGSEGWQLRVRALSEHVHRLVELPLAPLSEAAARELLAGLSRSQGLGEAELMQIVRGAEGNPFYLEELVNAFAEGNTHRRGQTFAPAMTGARFLTPTLESLLLARIDRLPRGARRLAQVAAVIGRNFPLRALEHVAETEDLEGEMAELLRADVIREFRRHPELEYQFRHGLLREASLSTLPPSRRRELYSAVGAAFERLFADSLDDHLEVLAHYFARSQDLQKALDYLERAGGRAESLDAVATAADLWDRALQVAEKLGDSDAEQRLRPRLEELRARSGERLTSTVRQSDLRRRDEE